MKSEKQPFVWDKDKTPSNYSTLSKTLDTIEDETGQLKGLVMDEIPKFFKTPTKEPEIFESKELTKNNGKR